MPKLVVCEASGNKFVCQYCSKQYPSKDRLLVHQRKTSCAAHRPGARTWPCQHCNVVFKSKYTLHEHQKESLCSGSRWQCSRCKTELTTKRMVVRHIKNGACFQACNFCLGKGLQVYKYCNLARSSGSCSKCIRRGVPCVKSDDVEGVHPVEISQSRHSIEQAQQRLLTVNGSEDGEADDGHTQSQHYAIDQAGLDLPSQDYFPTTSVVAGEYLPDLLPSHLGFLEDRPIIDHHSKSIGSTQNVTVLTDHQSLPSIEHGYQSAAIDTVEQYHQQLYFYHDSVFNRLMAGPIPKAYNSHTAASSSFQVQPISPPLPESEPVLSASVQQNQYYGHDGYHGPTPTLSMHEQHPPVSGMPQGTSFSAAHYPEPEQHFDLDHGYTI